MVRRCHTNASTNTHNGYLSVFRQLVFIIFYVKTAQTVLLRLAAVAAASRGSVAPFPNMHSSVKLPLDYSGVQLCQPASSCVMDGAIAVTLF